MSTDNAVAGNPEPDGLYSSPHYFGRPAPITAVLSDLASQENNDDGLADAAVWAADYIRTLQEQREELQRLVSRQGAALHLSTQTTTTLSAQVARLEHELSEAMQELTARRAQDKSERPFGWYEEYQRAEGYKKDLGAVQEGLQRWHGAEVGQRLYNYARAAGQLVAKNTKLKRALTNARQSNEQRNRELDALHYVWCDGGCEGGVHRYDEQGPGAVTLDVVTAAIRNTERLVSWFVNHEHHQGRTLPKGQSWPTLGFVSAARFGRWQRLKNNEVDRLKVRVAELEAERERHGTE